MVNEQTKECRHHEAVDVRLKHLEDGMRDIRRMFAAILVGLIINLSMNYFSIKESRNGTAQASTPQELIEQTQ